MGREIEFLAFLFFQRAKELAEGKEHADLEKSLEDFWRLHMSHWGEKFFRKCKELAASPAYRMMGILGEELCINTLPASYRILAGDFTAIFFLFVAYGKKIPDDCRQGIFFMLNV